jgi:hypothetical protein
VMSARKKLRVTLNCLPGPFLLLGCVTQN